VRHASRYLIAGLDDVALSRRGRIHGCEVTARAMAWVVVGHVAHHLGVLRERYGLRRTNA
jgi:hypothetical protein